MIILDKPYISKEMKEFLQESQACVLDNPQAQKESQGYSLHLAPSEELVSRFQEGERLYTASENSLSWVTDNLKSPDLLRSVHMMKDKAEFRRILQALYPDFYFQAVPTHQLDQINPDLLPLPVILKPAVGFFSLGVYTIQTTDDWRNALQTIYQQAEKWSAEFSSSVVNHTSFLIEQYIAGEEYALDVYFGEQGHAVILNIMKHDFSSAEDVSDRLYYTSREIVLSHIRAFEDYLNNVNAIIQARNFPAHVEIRVDQGRIYPIEFNPLRFAGWCCTDITYFAFGFKTYDYYLNNRRPDWDHLLAGKEHKIYTLIALNKPENFDNKKEFDYNGLCEHFQKVLCVRKVDHRQFSAFGFLFTETQDQRELDYIVRCDLGAFAK